MKNIDNIKSGDFFNVVSTDDLMNVALKLIPEMSCQLKDCNYSQEYINGMMFGMSHLAIKASLDPDVLMTVNIRKEADTSKEPCECKCEGCEDCSNPTPETAAEDSVEAFRKKVLSMLGTKMKTLRNKRLATRMSGHRVYSESDNATLAKLQLLAELQDSIEKL